ncbi:unnamed protein product [Cylicocyclus nassatus]|uniref:Uncharacterized protein n=1 Tax=Cylicocyclus nassatus TaxID=53992 RepID=A0AA36HIP0_CYLNA|nr:unnamed protein product [Cylicocyclus nassatus]
MKSYSVHHHHIAQNDYQLIIPRCVTSLTDCSILAYKRRILRELSRFLMIISLLAVSIVGPWKAFLPVLLHIYWNLLRIKFKGRARGVAAPEIPLLSFSQYHSLPASIIVCGGVARVPKA